MESEAQSAKQGQDSGKPSHGLSLSYHSNTSGQRAGSTTPVLGVCAHTAPSISGMKHYLFLPKGTLVLGPDTMAISHHHEVLVLLLFFVGRAGKRVNSGFLFHKFFSVCFSSLE